MQQDSDMHACMQTLLATVPEFKGEEQEWAHEAIRKKLTPAMTDTPIVTWAHPSKFS